MECTHCECSTLIDHGLLLAMIAYALYRLMMCGLLGLLYMFRPSAASPMGLSRHHLYNLITCFSLPRNVPFILIAIVGLCTCSRTALHLTPHLLLLQYTCCQAFPVLQHDFEAPEGTDPHLAAVLEGLLKVHAPPCDDGCPWLFSTALCLLVVLRCNDGYPWCFPPALPPVLYLR